MQKSGAKDESSRSGTLTFNMTLTHLNAARPREKVEWGPALLESKSLSDLVSRRRATRPGGRASAIGAVTRRTCSCPKRTSCYIIVHTSIHFAFVQQRA